MLYVIDFTQKKNGTFLVAASPVGGEKRVQAQPQENAESFLHLLKSSAACSEDVVSVLTEAAIKSTVHPDSPILCGPVELATERLAHLGLAAA